MTLFFPGYGLTILLYINVLDTGKGLRRALIRCTLGSGKSEKGLGFWRGGHKGAMGNKGEQFTDNLGPRWSIPVTIGGCQVSRKGVSKGNVHM